MKVGNALWVLAMMLIPAAPSHGAGTLGQLVVEFSAAGAIQSCTWDVSERPAGQPDKIQLTVLSGGNPVAPGVAPANGVVWQVRDAGGTALPAQPSFTVVGGSREASSTSPGGWANHSIAVTGPTPVPPSCVGKLALASDDGDESSDIALLANAYFDTNDTLKKQREAAPTSGAYRPGNRWDAWNGKRKFDMYLLPGGRVEFIPPKTDTLSEEDLVTIKVIAPKDATIVWKDAITCTPRDFGRTLGTPPGQLGQMQSKQSTDLAVYVDPGGPRRCAQFAWNIKIQDSAKADLAVLVGELKADADIMKSYLLSWGASVGLDFGSPTDYEPSTRINGSGAAELFVDKQDDTQGVTPLLTLTAHPCGMVPGRLTLCDRFSPFIGADPTRIDDGFVAGLNIMLFERVGVLLGASFYQSEKLSGLQNGQTIPPGVGLSTHEEFGSNGTGFFIGLNVSDAQTLRGLFSGLFGG